nr:sensor histidine kinase [Sporosalibacterium faouarense]
MNLDIFTHLTNRVGTLIILALILSKVKIFRKLVLKRKITLFEKIILSFVFGGIGIIGTYSGIVINGALANSRVIGVLVGGLLGGPFVGIFSGIIAGIHRWGIDIGGFTSLACAISTIIEGTIAGLLSKRFSSSKSKWAFALYIGVIAEMIQMIIILIVARPFTDALLLVKVIALPMIITNSIGSSLFIGVTDSIFKEQDRNAAYQAQIALRIANKTLEYFKQGFNYETVEHAAKIIYEMTDVKAVAITNTKRILTHIGIGDDHHKPGDEIKTKITKDVISTGEHRVAYTKEDIDCDDNYCKLKSAIIVPLKEGNKVVGTLKLYKTTNDSITQVDLELALGLGSLFSTQIELSKVEYQKQLLAKSELKALQAQINPHFLFNAINTIVSFVRIDPNKARKLLLHLSDYFRKNLCFDTDEVHISKEIEHVNSYLEIERARFGNKLNVEICIPEGIDCYLPPLILQPIVENSIKHGIMNKIEGGIIKIIATEEDDKTKIVIDDNGIGIEEGKLKTILSKNKDDDSIGIINVNERLINKYGNDYGLKISSEIGKGTTVTMNIPKRNGEEEEDV